MDDLETLRRKLDEIYLPLEQEGINGMRLLPQQNAGMGAAEAERLLNVRFPKQFAEIISRYDLGNFETNNIRFGSRGDYLRELAAWNRPDEWGGKWWQGANRPKDLIVFAMSDPYTYILNCADGTVCAMLPDDPWQTWRTVSCGFGIFLRSMAASDIGRIRQHPTENLLREILAATQSTESGFWRDNVEGNW